MRCEHTSYTLERCPNEPTETVWCPTWIRDDTTEPGPMHFCMEHAKVFRPENNPYAEAKVFYWGAEAYAAYERWKARGGKSPTLQDWYGGRINEVAQPHLACLTPP